MNDERMYSAATTLLFFFAMSISIYFRSRAARQSSENLREGGGGIPFILLRLTFVLSIFAFIVAYAINPAWVRWASLSIPAWIRIGGGATAVTMIGCFWWLFVHLGRNVTPTHKTRADHTLVTTGPYRWVRHPLYSAGIIFWFGISLLAATWVFMALTGAALLFLLRRVPQEEADLLEKFGDNYRAYMEHTGRFFPRVFT